MTACHARRLGLAVLILTWLAFVLRVLGLDSQSLWRDEVDSLRFATRALPDLLATFRQPGQNGPLFFLALRPWLAESGRSEFALRFPSAWTGVLAVPMLYVLVRRLAGWRPAVIAALLAAVAPYLIWYGQEAKMYAALTLLVPLSLWLTIEAGRRGKWWRWLLLYVVTTACIYVHLLAVLVVPVQVLWLLILPMGPRSARRWIISAGYLLALFLPYLPLLSWQAEMWLAAFQTGHAFVPLGDIFAVLAVAYSRGILPVRAPVTLLPAILALVAGLGLWATQESAPGEGPESMPAGRWRVVTAFSVWLFFPPVAVYAVSLRTPIFSDRYLIWCMPAFLALAAMGIAALARVWRPLGATVLAAALATGLASVWAQSSKPVKSDFRAAARFVAARQQTGDLLLFQFPYGRYVFSYYSNGREPDAPPAQWQLPWADGPFTNDAVSEAGVAEQLARETAGYRGVWLIASEVPLWDQRGLTQAWLSEAGTVTDQADFARVTVTRYELRR
jgi:mannosyltransferase